MFGMGSRKIIEMYEPLLKKERSGLSTEEASRTLLFPYEKDGEDGQDFGLNIQDVIRQSKIISQVVAFIWYYSDEKPISDQKDATWKKRHEQAIKGIEWYHNPASTNGSPNENTNLYNLLTIGDPRKPETTWNDYDRFLHTVFEEHLNDREFYKFPIYNPGTQGDPTIIFEVDYKAYEGVMSDLRVRTGRLQLLTTLSFPARPQYGKATFEASELERWYQDKNPDNRTPPSPFIPLCSC
ncbi:MAG: hypothetical protein F6K24_18185 [Okeania sp. SIO2D1]|nr:hypothetical protein [Okeania sp. SIO2D1]